VHRSGSRDCILFEVTKTMYGLPQAGKLAQDILVAHLADHGYVQDPLVAGLFCHVSNGLAFTLVVDDFGIKYLSRAHAKEHLAVLRKKYEVTVDWAGDKYLGMQILFDRNKGTVSFSMPGYVASALARFQHVRSAPTKSPWSIPPPEYGRSKPQCVELSNAEPLDAAQIHYCQQVVGTFLYYALAVDHTMLTAVTAIASELARPTTALLASVTRLLNYAATYPANCLQYHRSDMILHAHTDASYLSRSHARSVVGGFAYLGDPSNGALFALSVILDASLFSVILVQFLLLP